jgi:hypothetical protein
MRITQCLLLAILTGTVQAQTEKAVSDKAANEKAGSAEKKAETVQLSAKRREYMKQSVKDYEFLVGPEFQAKLTVEPEPLLRFTNPVSGLQDGGFFVWKTDAGRPMVGAQVFLTADDLWIHEFQSLAPVALKVTKNGKIIWKPNRAGVKVTPFPDAPAPADTPVKRLAQMRELAGKFTASDEFEGRPRSDELRLLSKPLVRFGREGSETLDGTLFVHAHGGTDPELMIVLEALREDGNYRWHYALAPMTGYALQASLNDKLVWQVPWRRPPFDPQEPFFILVHSRETSVKRLLDLFQK